MLKKNITKINNFFLSVYNSIENDTKNYREIIAFCLFCVGAIFVACFHEPWFDEFQVWEISKASLYDIFFVIPHFEGHPPFWALILKFFSFFNIDAELGIKIPNITFMIGAVFLLIFKSPFPRIFRVTLPFTYFIFYQTTIINRPYSVFCFALFLLAYLYKSRNETPFCFVLALFLLCLSSAYGMLFAAGITLAWFIEIWNKQNPLAFLKKFIKDSRFWAMLGLLFGAIVLAFIIYPDKDVATNLILSELNFLEKCIAIFLIIPADALVTDYFSNLTRIYWGLFLWQKIYYCSVCLLGLFFNILFLFIFKKAKKILGFVIPYFLFLVFCFKYVSAHHIALVVIFFIFIFWISFIDLKEKLQPKLFAFLGYLLIFVVIIQLGWTSASVVAEIRFDYDVGRSVAKYIKDNNLQQYNILSGWNEDVFFDEETQTYKTKSQLNFLTIPVIVNPYFKKNIFYNFNMDNKENKHLVLEKKTAPMIESIKKQWAELPAADVIVKNSKDYITFDGKKYIVDENYILVKVFYNANVWKNIVYSECVYLYVKKELAEKLGLKEYERIF